MRPKAFQPSSPDDKAAAGEYPEPVTVKYVLQNPTAFLHGHDDGKAVLVGNTYNKDQDHGSKRKGFRGRPQPSL